VHVCLVYVFCGNILSLKVDVLRLCVTFCQIMRFNEKEQRLVKECDRLRGHLVQIEDSYTREALEAEDREKQLRNKLAAVEEKMLTSSSAMQTAKSVDVIRFISKYK